MKQSPLPGSVRTWRERVGLQQQELTTNAGVRRRRLWGGAPGGSGCGGTPFRNQLLVAVVLTTAISGAGCRERSSSKQELTVLAAASLRDAFSALAREFERKHPSVTVRLSLASSEELRVQIQSGLVADVFASADEKNMATLESQGLVTSRRLFARNSLVIIAPAANSAGLRSYADLEHVPRLVLGVPEVPVGAYAVRMLTNMEASLGAGFRARVEGRVRSRELNSRQVLSKVVLGEADAGIVYVSDARAAGPTVTTIEIPPRFQVTATYPAAILKAAVHDELARTWLDLLLSDEGQRLLAQAGFQPVRGAP